MAVFAFVFLLFVFAFGRFFAFGRLLLAEMPKQAVDPAHSAFPPAAELSIVDKEAMVARNPLKTVFTALDCLMQI